MSELAASYGVPTDCSPGSRLANRYPMDLNRSHFNLVAMNVLLQMPGSSSDSGYCN
jgi:hypothetical protein